MSRRLFIFFFDIFAVHLFNWFFFIFTPLKLNFINRTAPILISFVSFHYFLYFQSFLFAWPSNAGPAYFHNLKNWIEIILNKNTLNINELIGEMFAETKKSLKIKKIQIIMTVYTVEPVSFSCSNSLEMTCKNVTEMR